MLWAEDAQPPVTPSFEDRSSVHCHFADRSGGAQPALVAGQRGKVAGAPAPCLWGGLFPVLTAVLGKAVSWLIPVEKEGEGACLASITDKTVCEL